MKVKVFTQKRNRFGKTLISSFGSIAVDEKGFAEIDAKNIEVAKTLDFFPVEEEIASQEDEVKDEAEQDSDPAMDDKKESTEVVKANIGGGAHIPKPDKEEGKEDDKENKPMSVEELEELKKLLLKKTNDDLKAILVELQIPETVFASMTKKELVEEILKH